MSRLFRSSLFWFTIAGWVVLQLGLVFSLWQWDWLRTGGSQTASNGDTLRNAGLLIGGALAFAFAGWRAWVADRQATTAQVEAATTQLQAEIARRSLLNERYERGAEMLGSEILSVHLGSAYALWGLAGERPEQYHVQEMQLLCAFVHNPVEIRGMVELPTMDTESPHGVPPLR